ncbi:MAG: signal peptidase I [Candidatus Gastranaerophilales bacterium]|nr:signal peptidase I [Candidatus Gastranaerophilales bacterium]
MKYKIKSFLKELIETIIVVTVLVVIIRGFIGEPRWIPSASMRSTLLEGDRVFIEKISANFTKPERGDILVFYPPFEKLDNDYWSQFTRFIGFFDKKDAYIKRVIGVGGDKIFITSDKKSGRSIVFVNDKKIDEPYLYENRTIECTKNMYCGPMVVPKGYYFMLGDNRANSQDARFWGFLPESRIIGKACFIFWPLNRIKLFEKPEFTK